MRKYMFIFLSIIATLISCDRDEICTDATTPRLIIKFYNNFDRTERKQVTDFYVWAQDKDSLPDYFGVNTDSIAIPLDVTEDFTKYLFSNNELVDNIEFTYGGKDEFVSRSCGFKTVFDELEIPNYTTEWIREIEILNNNVKDENETHINIYH
ncbi:DUF6452 family protein [Aureivirga sp. CE67]|uniref:DUF6452 family protein n=1 Tax=Aureivirga sp. CE67 TaxID=1788983 RepID=UPI0018CAF69B|nr:DUF6452 family protein [Aureivirga sp. CE67]